MMPSRQGKGDAYTDHERTVAGRYRWWGVYLMRERRRLEGIARAVGAGQEGETPEELLARLDAAPGAAGDPLRRRLAGRARLLGGRRDDPGQEEA